MNKNPLTSLVRLRAHILLPVLAALFVSGCAVGPMEEMDHARRLLNSDSVAREGGMVGIALAGGGTKAASYSMGVLAAVADLAEEFGQVDAISSVSGGGYASLFLYTKLLLREQDPVRPEKIREFFSDCLPAIYKDILPAKHAVPLCANDPQKNVRYRFQQFVRCRQDVLENDCKQELNGTDHSEYVNAASLLAGTGLFVLPNFAARTVFDWPVNLSPSRYAYGEGIGTTYGLYPLDGRAITETPDILAACKTGAFLNCDASSGTARFDRAAMGFADLRALTEKSAGKVPTWFINATASKSRSAFGWARKGQRNFDKYTFQMSPFGAHAGFYGPVDEYATHLDLLGAVTAAAAFFDSNEIALNQPWRMSTALGQHLAAMDWGQDIPNPNVARPWRMLHNVLPFPFYYIDGGLRQIGGARENQRSAYIRLLDGGNNDNLGAYTLIQAGMKHIFIADHAYDGNGKMEDVCRLHNEVRLRPWNVGQRVKMASLETVESRRKKLIIPGLQNLAKHCEAFANESECDGDKCNVVPGVDGSGLPEGNYPILGWRYGVLLGCIRNVSAPDADCAGEIDARIYLLKPALDLDVLKKDYIDMDRKTVKPNACVESEPGLCEVAAYIVDHFKRTGQAGDVGSFPQHSTAWMTFASDGKRYGAYRELARWHMSKALKFKAFDSDKFADAVRQQACCPILRHPVSEGLPSSCSCAGK